MYFELNMALRRIVKQLKDIENDPVPNCSAGPVGDDLFKWHVYATAPSDSVYDGGIFKFEITFPQDYPFKPFTLKAITKIYHPYIYESGKVDCWMTDGILKSEWSPALTVGK